MGSRVSLGRPPEELDESEVGEATGKNFAKPSPSGAALKPFMDLPYDFGVRASWLS
jgi:hypothetical protein